MFPNKPPGYPLLPSDQEPVEYNWNSSEMSWAGGEATAHTVMMFNGMTLSNQNEKPLPLPGPSTSGQYHRQPRVKRKSESDDFIPSKHFISEDKMVAHLNGLHLSDNFQQHNVTPEPTESTSSDEACFVNLSKEELEKRLKRAQRIIVCDQVKKTLQEEKEAINRMIMNRMDPPCRALVLWKPPPPIEKLLVNYDNYSASIQEEDSEDDMEDDNNNNNDPNNNPLDDVMME